MIKIKKGINIPISGRPAMQIEEGRAVSRVALLARDYPGVKPTFLVQEGERVSLGQPLFSDRKNPEVVFTAPGCGKIASINRGQRRVFVSLVIELDGDDEVTFPPVTPESLSSLTAEEIQQRLVNSGLWTCLRSRPFSKIPVPGSQPTAVFVTAIDTNPLAADPLPVIAEKLPLFLAGLTVLRHLTSGRVHLCTDEGFSFTLPEGISQTVFSGCHPAGLAGTHINFLEPVDLQRRVWQIGYQDVIAIGELFTTGRIVTERIVALGGPQITKPRLLRTRLGADLTQLTALEMLPGDNRIISGSLLSGHTASGEVAFLGRYHNQVCVLAEQSERKFLDWLLPGFDKHSVKRLFASALLPARDLPFTTSNHGALRAMVPVGAFEKVMPLEVQITWLLRSLLAGDLEMSQKLGCLELDEEDLALCSYVCSGKNDYGSHLRSVLDRIEEEGL